MKTAALLVLLTTTCYRPAGAVAGGAMEFRTVQSGGYAAASPRERAVHLAADAAAFKQLWDTLIGSGEAPPNIDFSKETAVFLLAGRRNSGGYSIDVHGGILQGSTLVVAAEVKGPPPGGIVTQAITSPWSVVAFSTRGAKDVRWAE